MLIPNGVGSVTLLGAPNSVVGANLSILNRLGILYGSSPSELDFDYLGNPYISQPGFCYFNNVSFWYAANDDPNNTLTLSGSSAIGWPVTVPLNFDINVTNTTLASYSLNINAATNCAVTLFMNGTIVLSTTIPTASGSPTPPTPSELGFTSTPSSIVLTYSSMADNPSPLNGLTNWNLFYNFNGQVYFNVVAGDNPVTLSLTLLPPSPPPDAPAAGSQYWIPRGGDATIALRSDFEIVSSPEQIVAIHPNSLTNRLQTTVNTFPTLKIGSEASGYYFSNIQWELSNQLTKGVWVANTLPTPAQNVFIAQDMPPYVGMYGNDLYYNEPIAVSSTLVYDFLGNTDNPPTTQPANNLPSFLDSMRQQAEIQSGYSYTVPFWDNATTYNYGDGATAANGDLYYSLQNGNLNHTLTDADWWAFLVPASQNSREPKYNLISQSVQCQPAQWLVKRDTDFVPFDYGFNNGEYVSSGYNNETALKDGSVLHLSINSFELMGAKSLKIRLVESWTAKKGWKNGALQYGEPLAKTLDMFVSKSGYPVPTNPATYDFVTNTNAVTIPGDGGRNYISDIISNGVVIAIAVGIARGAYDAGTVYRLRDIVTEGGNYYIYTGALSSSGNDPVTSSGFWSPSQDVAFDLVVEIDTVTNPVRQYHPETWECFSYSTDGSPWVEIINPVYPYLSSDASKPIPQNGYCIFKVRATRLPVVNNAGISVTPSNGEEISITLGQNQIQLDNSAVFAPFLTNQTASGVGNDDSGAGDDSGGGAGGTGTLFTITIPANARDSGDVDVFIPVLGGNELIWQIPPMTVTNCLVNSTSQGVGYNSGQTVVVSGGVLSPGSSPANIVIDSTDAEGRPLSAHVSFSGYYTTPPPISRCPVTSNGGTGATFDLTMSGVPGVIVEAWANWQPMFKFWLDFGRIPFLGILMRQPNPICQSNPVWHSSSH